jgi:hypothetical protein
MVQIERNLVPLDLLDANQHLLALRADADQHGADRARRLGDLVDRDLLDPGRIDFTVARIVAPSRTWIPLLARSM